MPFQVGQSVRVECGIYTFGVHKIVEAMEMDDEDGSTYFAYKIDTPEHADSWYFDCDLSEDISEDIESARITHDAINTVRLEEQAQSVANSL